MKKWLYVIVFWFVLLGVSEFGQAETITVDSDEQEVTVQFASGQLIDLRLLAEVGQKIWILLEVPPYPAIQFGRPSDQFCETNGRYAFPLTIDGNLSTQAEDLYYAASCNTAKLNFGIQNFTGLGKLTVTVKKGASAANLEVIQKVTFIETWNSSGDFELDQIDTGNHQNECYIDAPWGDNSWGTEAFTFSDPEDHTIDCSRFTCSQHEGYLYVKDESGQWGVARYIQGDIWGGSHCGTIHWNIPEPLSTKDKDITLDIDILRDTNELLSSSDSWIMFAANIWLTSPGFPEGEDINGRKPLVLDLIFYHDCRDPDGCDYEHREDDNAFHYQTFIGETPYRQWRSWSVSVTEHIQNALDYQWTSGNLSHAKDTLQLYQAEFVVEVKNAEGAASIDNFFLRAVDEPQESNDGPTSVALVGPPNDSTTDGVVTFEWNIVNPKSDVTYHSVVYTDKGTDPLDGGFEDAFDAGDQTSMTVTLPSSRYSNTSFQWAVLVEDSTGEKYASEVWRLNTQ